MPRKTKYATRGRPKKVRPEDAPPPKDNTIYARVTDPELMRYIYGLMAESSRTMREIIEMMVKYCMDSKRFKVDEKMPLHLEQQLKAREIRMLRYKKLSESGGE